MTCQIKLMVDEAERNGTGVQKKCRRARFMSGTMPGQPAMRNERGSDLFLFRSLDLIVNRQARHHLDIDAVGKPCLDIAFFEDLVGFFHLNKSGVSFKLDQAFGDDHDAVAPFQDDVGRCTVARTDEKVIA